MDAAAQSVIRELIEDKTLRVLKALRQAQDTALPDGGAGWAVHYAFFARAGFTDAAQASAATHGALLVDLARLDRYLETTNGP